MENVIEISLNELIEQVHKAKKEFITDGYSMSIGELVTMYREEELIVNPDFQRKFRWSIEQQSRLIESILIGVPLPSIFVYQNEKGNWEVVDGIQRVSTILLFMGYLKGEKGNIIEPSILSKTKLLPALAKMSWSLIPKELQLEIRRSKIEVKIIKSISDENAKFEVFQRLNYAPTILSGQEYRDALLIMLDKEQKELFGWIGTLANDSNFKQCIDLTERWLEEKYDRELVLRLFIFSLYKTLGNIYKIDDYLNEYLFYDTDSLVSRIKNKQFDLSAEKLKFQKTFELLNMAKGKDVFKKQGKGTQFLESYFEAIALGLYANIESYSDTAPDIEIIRNLIDKIENSIEKYPNASSRIPKMVQFGKTYFTKNNNGSSHA